MIKMKKKKQKNIYTDFILGQILNVVSPFVEVNPAINLVLFGLDITELRMHKNQKLVNPVSIVAPFAGTLFSCSACDLIMQADVMLLL